MAKKTSKKTIGDTMASAKRRGILPPLKMTPSLLERIHTFKDVISEGYSDDRWNEAVYLLGDINQEAPLGVVEKLGSILAEAYVDPSRVQDRIESLLLSHYPVS